MTAHEYLILGVECFLRELSDSEYDELVRRVRPAMRKAAV